MSVSVNRKYLSKFISEHERDNLKPYVEVAPAAFKKGCWQ